MSRIVRNRPRITAPLDLDGPGTAGSFLGLPDSYSSADAARFAVQPVAFDASSSYLAGSRLGPAAIIEASRYLEVYDIESNCEGFRYGIHTTDEINADTYQDMATKLSQQTAELVGRGHFVMTLGGEHSITRPTVEGYSGLVDKITIVQFDAHTDLRQDYEGDRNSHACVMARCLELPFVDRVIAIGIRAMDQGELSLVKDQNVFYAHAIAQNSQWMSDALARIQSPVYVTFDLDVFDPSILPATGTPEPGGLDWWQATHFLRKLFEQHDVVGCDIVELCPNGHKPSEFLAAKLAYTIMCAEVCKQNG